MFENLLYQNRIRDRLTRDILQSSLPQSLLFSGPAYSGKNTAALELARVINCFKAEAQWDCTCPSCHNQRLLNHPDVLLLGRSSFLPDVSASLDLLERRDAPASRYMVIRNLRKLLRRFDSVLWEGEEKKLSKISKAMEEVNQWTMDIAPGKELPAQWEKERGHLLKMVRDMEKAVPLSIPINQIRRINQWSHLGSQGSHSRKVVIIDKADQMQDGARNALLKLLEEPPKDVYIILISTRKKRILPTILSRVRAYDFCGRDNEAAEAIQKRIFREESPEPTLQEYFRGFRMTQGESSLAEKFLLSIYEKEKIFPQKWFESYEKDELPLFFHELMEQMRQWLREGEEGELPGLSLSVLERWNQRIRESYRSLESLNLNALLLLEDLFYRLRKEL